MPKFEDLTGKTIGFLTVLYRAEDYIQPSGQHKRMWHCRCICGNECNVRANDLKSGNTTSCGCKSSRKKSISLIDLTGQRFGDFIVLERDTPKITLKGQSTTRWKCQCQKCGKVQIKAPSVLKKSACQCDCSKQEIRQNIKNLKEKEREIIKQQNIQKKKDRQESLKQEKIIKQEIKEKKKQELLISNLKNNSFEVWCKQNNDSILSEWDYKRNNILPSEITYNSSKKIWWICKLGHSYDMKISSRTGTQKSGCPYCSVPAKRILKGFNDLATTNPEVLTEWDYEKNEINPNEISSGSGKKVWWKCKKGHSFEQSITYKVKAQLESTCPYCSHQKLLAGYNDLATTHAYVLKEWDYEKNTLLPTQIGVGTHYKAWWKCPFGHSYQAYPSKRCGKQHTGCPICNKENHTSFPEQAILYYVKKYFPDAINSDRNEIDMELDIYIPSIKTAIEYDGYNWHNKNSTEIKKNKACKDKGITLIRIRESGLPIYDDCICITRTDNRSNDSLSKAIKDILLKLCNQNINIDIEKDEPDIYSSYINVRREKSLTSAYPQIALEWHPTKNKDLTPMMVAPATNKKVWWLGKCGHEYQMPVSNRTTQNCGCPYCSGKNILVGYNDFATWCKENKRDDLLCEWNDEKNILYPVEVTKSSDKKVWWKCQKCGYEWQAKVDSRTRMNAGCPQCGKKTTSMAKYKAVINLDTNTRYESIKQASQNTGIAGTCISNVCNGKQKTAGGYKWKYINELE